MSVVRGHSRAISARARRALALSLALAASAAAQQTGSIQGTVRTSSSAVANARAILDSTREERSDSSGRFAFHDVPVGRHTLEVLSIGTVPYRVSVIVAARDTLRFDVLVDRIVTLDSVLVEGSTVRQGFVRDYEDRKRVGLGRFLDSLEVRKFGIVPQSVSFLPGVRYRNGAIFFTAPNGSLCLPNVWVDKQNWGTDQGVLLTMRPDDVMAIEVYTRNLLIPEDFRPRGISPGCGALVIWTRRLWPQGKGRKG